jgi:hypothetical protein
MNADQGLSVTVGGAVDESLPEAFEAWRKQYQPSESLESALLHHTLRRGCDLVLLSHGFLRLTVTITARRPWQSDSYFFTYRMVGMGEYIRDGKA